MNGRITARRPRLHVVAWWLNFQWILNSLTWTTRSHFRTINLRRKSRKSGLTRDVKIYKFREWKIEPYVLDFKEGKRGRVHVLNLEIGSECIHGDLMERN